MNSHFIGTRLHASRAVAQTCSLLYRRLAVGRASAFSRVMNLPTVRRMKFCDTAGCKPALRRLRVLDLLLISLFLVANLVSAADKTSVRVLREVKGSAESKP